MTATAWSDQTVDPLVIRKRPVDDYGKLRISYFHYKNATGGTLPDGTEIDLFDLPPGVVRIFIPLCRFKTVVAGGASRVLDMGMRAYASKYNPNPTALEVEDDDAFLANVDISSALGATVWPVMNDLVVDLSSRKGIRVFATIDGGTIPADLEIEGFCVYAVE
jgi:hypothetical protein